MSYKIGFLTTHPIQYQVPVFRELTKVPDIDLTVFYCMVPDEQQQGDGFGVKFRWDIPLLEGYKYEALGNVAKDPSVSHFFGCDTPGIYQAVRDGKFDAFIVNGWVVKSCLQLLLACRRYGVPCIVRGESNALRPRALWKRIIHRILLSQYAAFLNIGKSNRDFYLQNGVSEEKIFFAPYCIENERFERAADALRPKRHLLRRQWGIEPEACVFLFCAKFIPKKRPMDALLALKAALGRQPGSAILRLLMVGDGELRQKCESFAKENSLPVAFAGFLNQSEIVKAYVASDCLALPSDNGETWGLVVNEAMACGLPALVSDQVGCCADLVEDGITGSVFPFGDIEALSLKLAAMATDAEKRIRMGETAKERIREYSIENVVKGILQAVDFVMKVPKECK